MSMFHSVGDDEHVAQSTVEVIAPMTARELWESYGRLQSLPQFESNISYLVCTLRSDSTPIEEPS